MILLLLTVVASLSAGHGITHHFTLRNQLDPDILEALEDAEKKLSFGLTNDNGALKLSSMTLLELKPLYFHHGNLTAQVSSMYVTSSEFTIEETNTDVLGHRMMPRVHFPWIEVNGKLKVGLGNSQPQKLDFRILQNHLRSQGIMSLTADLVNVTWSYFYFKPDTSSFVIEKFDGGSNSDVLNILNGSQFGDLLAKKLQRDISNQLTGVVSKSINQKLKATSELIKLQPYSEEISAVGVNNTENANTFIDSLLKVGGAMIRGKFGDRIKIPDIQEEFSEKFLITFRGSFQATEGAAIGTSSVYRIGDVVFGYDNKSLLHFYGTLGFEALHLYYDHYKAKVWSLGPSGSLDTSLTPLSVLVHVHLNASSKVITLERFKIANVGDLEVKLTGLGGMLNWLVSLVTTWVVGLFRDRIIQQLESTYEQYGQYVFSTYSIEELLNGGKNEAYVL